MKNRKEPRYETYIYQILKEISPDTNISKQSVVIFSQLAEILRERIVDVSSSIAVMNKWENTLARATTSGMKIVLPIALGIPACGFVKDIQANAIEDSKRTKEEKEKLGSLNKRLGLTLAVSRVKRITKDTKQHPMSNASYLIVTAAIEFVLRELLHATNDELLKSKRKTITPRNILNAIKNNDEFKILFSKIKFVGAGVSINVPEKKRLKPKRRQMRASVAF